MPNPITNRRIGIVGGGNAGLICALILQRTFPQYHITVIKSDEIGTIGVGEGSTEQWRSFIDYVGIEPAELIVAALATHKKGIFFEGWNDSCPDFFHATAGLPSDTPFVCGFNVAYAKMLSEGMLLTDNTGQSGIRENKVPAINPHQSVNQFHFDTHELNDFLTMKASSRGIVFVEGIVLDVKVIDGWIKSVRVMGEEKNRIADFWIDASGFNRILMSHLSDTKWNSFGEYLLTDSAIAFRTESDPSGEIRPYTRARALTNGWAWEIPTQTARGNGYVYSSQFYSEQQAVKEMEDLLGLEIPSYRHFKFDPGYLDEAWVGNCVAVGLAGSFVEPLEATSIGTTIHQCFALLGLLAAFKPGNEWSIKEYNRMFTGMMLNVLDMIRLHYVSDREDTEFWRAQKTMPIPESLTHLLGLWSERPPDDTDIQGAWLLFRLAHMYHVGQGQGVLNADAAEQAIMAFDLERTVENYLWRMRESRTANPVKDHAEALKELIED